MPFTSNYFCTSCMRHAISFTLDSLVSLLDVPASGCSSSNRESLSGTRTTTLLYILRMIVYFYFIMLSTHWGHIALLPAAWSKLIGNVHVWWGGSHIVWQSQVSDNIALWSSAFTLCNYAHIFWIVTLLAFDSRCIEWKRRLTALDGVSASLVVKNYLLARWWYATDTPLVVEVRNDSSCDLDHFNNFTRSSIVPSSRATT